jgi:EAL domain-containing protein (putative c-di-GMP-specific phosphodiesterase class I)
VHALETSRLSPRLLTLEITESVLGPAGKAAVR